MTDDDKQTTILSINKGLRRERQSPQFFLSGSSKFVHLADIRRGSLRFEDLSHSTKWTALLLIAFCLTSSCQRFIDDPKPPERLVQYESKSFYCLNEISPTLGEILRGKINDREINQASNCIHNALTEFAEKTTDKVYTIENLVHFFNRHLLDDKKIQPGLQTQLMKLKKMILGGSETELTRAELASLIGFFDLLGRELKNIGPHIPLLLRDKNIANVTAYDVDHAVTTAQKSLKALFDLIQTPSGSYGLKELSDLAEEISDFSADAEIKSKFKKLSSYLQFMQTCMRAGFGTDATDLKPSEMRHRADALIRGYGLYLEYYFLHRENGFETSTELEKWTIFIDKTLHFIETDLSLETKGFSYSDIKNVVIDLNNRNWMPGPISADAFDQTLKILFKKVARGSENQVSESVITFAQWQNLRWEYSKWRSSQLLLAKAPFNKNGYISIPKLLNWMERDQQILALLSREISISTTQKLDLKRSWLDLRDQLSQPRSIRYNSAGNIVLVDSQLMASYGQTWENLLRFNSVRAISRLLFLGYGNKTSDALSLGEIPEVGLITWRKDFTPIGVELKVFDPRVINSGARSFLEANLFTAFSNGRGGIDYNEGFQYVSYLFAAGLASANNIYNLMQGRGCARPETDIFGNHYLDENCFKRNLKENFKNIFANLPGQVGFISSMSQSEWETYYEALLKVSRAFPTYSGQRIETTDIRNLVTVSHYVESLYTQFDTDRSGLLSDSEIKLGAARFLPILRQMRPGVPDLLLEEGFIALIVNGEMPSLQDLLGSIWQGVSGQRSANRLSLLKAIDILKHNHK